MNFDKPCIFMLNYSDSGINILYSIYFLLNNVKAYNNILITLIWQYILMKYKFEEINEFNYFQTNYESIKIPFNICRSKANNFVPLI